MPIDWKWMKPLKELLNKRWQINKIGIVPNIVTTTLPWRLGVRQASKGGAHYASTPFTTHAVSPIAASAAGALKIKRAIEVQTWQGSHISWVDTRNVKHLPISYVDL